MAVPTEPDMIDRFCAMDGSYWPEAFALPSERHGFHRIVGRCPVLERVLVPLPGRVRPRARRSVIPWRAPLRSGTVNLGDVLELRPDRFGSNAEVIQMADGARILVFVRKGFRAFTDELVARRPELPVRFGLQARWLKRLPGWSGFKRGKG